MQLIFHRELSKGHFSDDNQKRLNGTNTEIPIYEAKMTRDSRLIVSTLFPTLYLENDNAIFIVSNRLYT